ncbi:MAG: hypothetical protein ABI629_21160 [bacterium]
MPRSRSLRVTGCAPAPRRIASCPGSDVPRPVQADLIGLLDALSTCDVEFIVVGGAAALLHGGLAMTQDLDIVPRLVSDNIERLVAALAGIDTEIREPGTRHLRPTAELLAAGGQVRLLSNLGPLDVLGRLHDGRSYDDLLAHSEWIEDGTRHIRVVDLATLIEIKSAAGRAKDRIVLPMLVRLLQDRKTDT